jgi:stage V sporulation protein B
VLSIAGAKLYFIAAGYAVQLLLPRLLGSPETFGLYASAMNPVSILNNVLITATVQTVSKHVSEDFASAGTTLRQALVSQLLLGGGLSFSLWALSPWLAESVLLDPLLTPLLRIAAIVLLSYALYAALVGMLNGQQRFAHQARLDMTYTTLRSAGMLGAAALGFGAAGAMSGFAGATIAVMTIAFVVVGLGTRGQTVDWKRWFQFMAPLWLYQLALNLVLQVDLSVLKGNAAALGQAAGMLPVAAAEEASRLVGFYRAAQTFAFVPYQLILSVTFVVFPMVSKAVSAGRDEETRGYVRASLRFSLIVLLAVAAPFSGAASGVMRIAYPGVYLAGSSSLAVLAFGIVAFSLFVIGSTILSGAGKPGLPATIAVITVVFVLAADTWLLRWAGLTEHSLLAVASGTTFGMVLALAATGVALQLRFGAFIAPLCALRVLGSAACGWWAAHVLPTHSALSSLIAVAAGGVAYLIALIACRELGPTDLAMVTAIIRRQPRPR